MQPNEWAKSYSQFNESIGWNFLLPGICGYLRHHLKIMSTLAISPNHVVGIAYTLTVADGEVVDFADVASPLLFIHGIGQTIEAFDDQLNGLKVGDTFDFELTAANGYGEIDPKLVVDLPKSIFEGEDIPEDILEIDAVLPLQDSEGNPLDGRVVEIGEDFVKVDLNHPLAGEDLHFKGEILSVREASQDELDHGHVHGEGGHHH